jgi:malate dehydrogenase (oxaloacetate-decarboxylating)(NADP+)
VAQKPIIDMEAYGHELSARLDPMAATMHAIAVEVTANPQRVVFAEGEEEKAIRAAVSFRNSGFGHPVLVGRQDRIEDTMKSMGLGSLEGIEIHNAAKSEHNKEYTDFLYKRLQRQGYLYRDCQRFVNQDRNIFAACLVAMGDADAMVTGLTRTHAVVVNEIAKVIDTKDDEILFGLTMLLARGRTVFICDTTIHETPTAEQLADIATGAAAKVRRMGHDPRVAFLSYSSFGSPPGKETLRARQAKEILDSRQVDFEYDGEMGANIALDGEVQKLYPFCKLSGPANILVMPGLHSANISYKLIHKLGGGTVIGPMLIGLSSPVQIVHLDANVSDVVNMAVLAAHDAIKG